MLGKSVVADDKVDDRIAVLPADSDQPDNMEISAAIGEKERQERKKEGTEGKPERTSSTLQDLSQFETAPTHQRVYPSLPPMDTQLSFLTPSAQPSAPPPMQLDNGTIAESSRKGPEQKEPTSGRDSPRISTLLALRSTRVGAKKPTATSSPPPPPSSSSSSSMVASSSSSSLRSAASVLESLQLAKKQGDDMTAPSGKTGEKKVPTKTSPSKSGSSSKRKPSPRSVRHAVPVIANKSSQPSGSSSGNGNGTKTSSPESDFETALEGVREGESSDREQASEGEGGENGRRSEVIIRTNTYTHLGTKRKSTGAFGSTSSTDSSTSSESWQTAAQASESGNNGGGSSPPPLPPPAEGGPTPTKRLRSLATPSAPSLRRALGGTKATTPQQPPRNSSPSSAVKNSSRGSPKVTVKNGSSQNSGGGHGRSLSIGSGLAAILSRPVSGKLLMKSPSSFAGGDRGQKQPGDPVVKKEPTSHSWIAQFFHKS